MEIEKLKPIVEALLTAAQQPMSVNHIFDLFAGDLDQPGKDDIRQVLQELTDEYQGRGFQIKQVASGFRLQVNPDHAEMVTRLFQQKPPRYSRALLETLALIAYRQPITRGEIESIRGVSVSSNIIKTLQERDWVRTLGHKDVPGKPSLYGTTSRFLDYFNLKSLNELPTLSELKDLDQYHPELEFEPDQQQAVSTEEQSESDSIDEMEAESNQLRVASEADAQTERVEESEQSSIQ